MSCTCIWHKKIFRFGIICSDYRHVSLRVADTVKGYLVRTRACKKMCSVWQRDVCVKLLVAMYCTRDYVDDVWLCENSVNSVSLVSCCWFVVQQRTSSLICCAWISTLARTANYIPAHLYRQMASTLARTLQMGYTLVFICLISCS